jgi:hypothetical protein
MVRSFICEMALWLVTNTSVCSRANRARCQAPGRKRPHLESAHTANAGLGAKYYITDNLFVDFNGRYRYYSRLVNNFGKGMNTAETSLGVGWHF